MKIILAISLIFIFSACQVLKKKNRSSSWTSEDTSYKIDINHENDLERLFDRAEQVQIRRDAVSVIEIKPVGGFTITQDGTYIGEGGTVLIQNTATEERNESQRLIKSRRDKSRIQSSLEENTFRLEDEKILSVDVNKTSSIQGYAGVGIAILIVVLGFMLARKFKII